MVVFCRNFVIGWKVVGGAPFGCNRRQLHFMLSKAACCDRFWRDALEEACVVRGRRNALRGGVGNNLTNPMCQL